MSDDRRDGGRDDPPDDGGEDMGRPQTAAETSAPVGYRKDGRPFKEGNAREDGSYAVGRNRTPEHSRFAKDDGRKRGRRKKGVRNADTEFMRELGRKVTIKENGKERKVSKSHAVDLRLIDNATRKGDNRAIEMIDQRRQRIAEKAEASRHYQTLGNEEILSAYLRQRSAELQIDPDLFGDPEPENAGQEQAGD